MNTLRLLKLRYSLTAVKSFSCVGPPGNKLRAQVAMNNSEAYKVNKVADATAVSSRLMSLNEMYVTNPKLVRTNLWYENIQDILGRLNIVFVDGANKSNIFLGDVPVVNTR